MTEISCATFIIIIFTDNKFPIVVFFHFHNVYIFYFCCIITICRVAKLQFPTVLIPFCFISICNRISVFICRSIVEIPCLFVSVLIFIGYLNITTIDIRILLVFYPVAIV